MEKESQTKIIFIVPYYGKLPEYFSMWLKSVSYNPTIHFLFITDIKIEQQLPPNVRHLDWKWEELLSTMQKPFDFKINVKNPYNLCDFRPAYGLIFQEYIREYDFWGNCDIDQIFGDVRKFMTEEILKKNDVIGYLGHFTLYRNIKKINYLFMLPGSLFDYKVVFSNEECYAFDELTGIKKIVEKNNINHFNAQQFAADIMTAHKQFKIGGEKNYKYQVFYWEEGKVYRAFLQNNEVIQEEYMYIHFQKKSIAPLNENIKTERAFYIHDEFFFSKVIGKPEMHEIVKYSNWNGRAYEYIERIKKNYSKVIKFWNVDKKQKKIWIEQKKDCQYIKRQRLENKCK